MRFGGILFWSRMNALVLKKFLMKLPGMYTLARLRTEVESRWFDFQHRIHTYRQVTTDKMIIGGANSPHATLYCPTHLRSGRQVFRNLPIADFSRYIFIDFGSGKGRMLFLAAEHPFRSILGIEFAADLHATAEENIRRYRNPKQACFDIRSLNIDAAEFDFPNENCVLYFFFPFRRPVMEPLIDRLDRSLDQHPRDIILVYMNPELADIIEHTNNLRLHMPGRYYNIYRSLG
jgi:SAM-dependent methyltransferase